MQQFHRPGPPTLEIITASYQQRMSATQCAAMLSAIRNSSVQCDPNADTFPSELGGASLPILFEFLYPSVVRLPGSSTVEPLVSVEELQYSVNLQVFRCCFFK